MIGYLEGTARTNGGRTIVLAGGVGWAVTCAAPVTDGDQVALWVTTVVRENDISLYGFTDSTDQDMFDALCKVPRVGPAAAIALLTDVGTANIVAAARTNDVGALTAARGIGRAAATGILTSLKIPASCTDLAPAPTPAPVVDVPADELVEALTALGFDRGSASNVLTDLRPTYNGRPEADLLSAAIAELTAA